LTKYPAPRSPLQNPSVKKMASLKLERHYVQHKYHDHSREPPSCEEDYEALKVSCPKTPCRKYGPPLKFPLKLHKLLENSETNGLSDVISWRIHGRAFSVNSLKKFSERVMPLHFNQTKIKSFFRQLNLYGFLRITQGPDRGAYYHELFLRGRPFLASKILRQKVKGTRVKGLPSPETEPNFYSMPYVMGTLSHLTMTIPTSLSVVSDDLMLLTPSSTLPACSSSSSPIFTPKDNGVKYKNLIHLQNSKNVSHSSEASVSENFFSSLQTGSKIFLHDEGDLGKLFFESISCENSVSDFSIFDSEDSCVLLQDPKKPFDLLYVNSEFTAESEWAADDVSVLDEDDRLNCYVQHYSLQEYALLCAALQD
jgi:hypothetical protein